MATTISDKQIEALKKQFKGRGRIFTFGLRYLTYKKYFVNCQYDNVNYCAVAISDSGKSESVMALFKTRKAAVEFGIALGLKEVPAPAIR